jgi:NADP-reducing hydrogenase subunit HndB
MRDRLKGTVDLRDGDEDKTRIVVGMATCGIAAGARPVLAAFTEEIAKRAIRNVSVGQTGCIGICQYEPVVEVFAPGKDKVTYVKMTPERAVQVVNSHIINGSVVSEFTIGHYTS